MEKGLDSPVRGVELAYVQLKNGIRLRVASAGRFFVSRFVDEIKPDAREQVRKTVRPSCSCTDGPNPGSHGDIK